MARPEQPLKRDGSPLREFAVQLRSLRAASGLTYAQLAAQTAYSVSTLQEAAAGRRLPTLSVTLAFAKASGGDPEEWRQHWERVHALSRSNGHSARPDAVEPSAAGHFTPMAYPEGPAGSSTAPREQHKHSRLLRRTRRLWLIGAVVTVVAAAAACAAVFAVSDPPARASATVIVVQNKVAIGPDQLVEDSTPVYLSSRTVSRCARRGCKLSDTDMWSGAKLVATCWTRGERLTNQDAASEGIQRNKNRVTSDVWYRTEWPDGRTGYLSEVYVVSSDRGGLGLGRCSPRAS
ncbi:hypothetical protein TUSST3_37850 [Streptomyces sp. TUS-ST3]|uniref:helix-turn-helix domain-containing protein n=1 Tax=Streptomyces sp. TUS-ST3 TaxID=3025591 RepID=UPI00235B3609|nr:helix-turn-helix transcriptional regulator [Streptomyces sp. TUS-ST3]GLP67163.1 hypothetical protein TUSST3_37850 [Streptomyces sp. TUS-ST3]